MLENPLNTIKGRSRFYVNQLAGGSPGEFAEEIGMKRDTVQKVLKGANKPSADFILAALNRYNKINVNWWMSAQGQPFITVYESHTLHILPKDARAYHVTPEVLKSFPQVPNPNRDDNCTFAIMAPTSAMKPDIKVGDTLFCSETKLDAFFDERRICLVAVGDDLRLRKLKKVAEGYELKARDSYYKTVTVPEDQITGVWYIEARHGSIKGYSSRGKK